MNYPLLRIVYDRKHHSTPEKKGKIELEIYFERTRKWLSTGLSVYPHQWDPERHIVNHPDAHELNLRLQAFKKPINDYILKLMMDGKPFNYALFELELEKRNQPTSFIEYVAMKIETRTDIEESTRRSHRRLNAALRDFNRIKTFDDLHPQLMRRFDDWLRKRDLTQSTIAVYHRIMKTYINLAIADGLYDHDPYMGFRVDKGRAKERKYLTEAEIERIKKVKSRTKMIRIARDLFIFQCYTGLAYADMMSFDFTKVKEVNGKYLIRDTRQKTEQAFNLVLLSPAVEILMKYDWKLPKISNQKYNIALKSVAMGAHITTNVTSHVARHTFACYCINRGVAIEVIAAMMGHSDIKTTQIYTRMVNKTVEKAFDMLEANL